MAKTALQRKRDQLKRQKEELRLRPDSTYPYLKEPFYKWLDRTEGHGDWHSVEIHCDASRITIDPIVDDSDPHSVDGEVELIWQDRPEESHYAGFKGSIGRAELLVDDLLAAASNIALVINTYKREQIAARIKELEEADLSDPVAKKKAFSDIVRLRKMLERLEKMTRHSVYEYKIKDI